MSHDTKLLTDLLRGKPKTIKYTVEDEDYEARLGVSDRVRLIKNTRDRNTAFKLANSKNEFSSPARSYVIYMVLYYGENIVPKRVFLTHSIVFRQEAIESYLLILAKHTRGENLAGDILNNNKFAKGYIERCIALAPLDMQSQPIMYTSIGCGKNISNGHPVIDWTKFEFGQGVFLPKTAKNGRQHDIVIYPDNTILPVNDMRDEF